MTSLANARPSTGHVAAQNHIGAFFAGLASLFASFSRALEFSRLCEAEYNRKGEVPPDAFKRFMDQV